METSEIYEKFRNNPNYKLSLFEMIAFVSNNPGVFGCDSLRTVGTFIEGYVYLKPELYEQLRGFEKWLVKKLKAPRNWGWFSIIESKYPTDKEAIEAIPKLFSEFENSKTSSRKK